MKLAVIVALLLHIFSVTIVKGQRTIAGRILDAESKKPITNVNVIVKGTTKGAVTNYLGFFQLDLQTGDSLLVCSHVAFETAEFTVPKQDKLLFQLVPSITALTTLDISGFKDDMKYEIGEEPAYDPSASLELNARFKGGEEGIFNYLGENFHLPDSGSVQGVVRITFTVDKTGRTRKIIAEGDTLNGVGAQLTHLFEAMPTWMPAAQRGVQVDQRFQVNVKFSNMVYLVVEQPASFAGGIEEFYKYIMKNLKYSPEARKKRIEGKVFVEFVITKTGKIDPDSVRVLKGLGYGLDEEAVRVIKGSPDWIPGTQRGETVSQKMVVPLSFKFQYVNPNNRSAKPSSRP
jgi:protein TonB